MIGYSVISTYKLLIKNSIKCVMLLDIEYSFVTHLLLVMQYNDCLTVKGVVQ